MLLLYQFRKLGKLKISVVSQLTYENIRYTNVMGVANIFAQTINIFPNKSHEINFLTKTFSGDLGRQQAHLLSDSSLTISGIILLDYSVSWSSPVPFY